MSLPERILDRLVSIVSPQRAAERRLARVALSEVSRLSAFQDALANRLETPVTSNRGTAADYDLELGFDRRRLVERSRMFERSVALASTLLDRAVEAVVGEGWRLQIKTSDKGWNEEAEALWRDWCDNEADHRGLLTFDEICAMMYRGELRDGDAAAIYMEDGTLRLIESDEISSPTGAPYARANMVDGVELDLRGRPVAFHVYSPDLHTIWADRRAGAKRVRVPAEQFHFMARRQRAGQTRGVTVFQGIYWPLEQIDKLVESVVVSARMAACFGLVIKRQGAQFTTLPSTTDSQGNNKRKLSLEPGATIQLRPGEDIGQIAPAHPTANLEGLVRLLLRIVGTRFGQPLEIALNDYSQVNFTSGRAAVLGFLKKRRIEQAPVGRFYVKTKNWKLLQFIEQGKLSYRPDALRHLLIRPGLDGWLDPVAEVQATQAAIDSNLETHAGALAKFGYDFDELVEQRKHEIETLRAAGLTEVRSTITRDPVAPAAAPAQGKPAPEDAQDEEDDSE